MKRTLYLLIAALELAALSGCVYARNKLDGCADRLVTSDGDLARRCLNGNCDCRQLALDDVLDPEIQRVSLNADPNAAERQRLDGLADMENLIGLRQQVQEMRETIAQRNEGLAETRVELNHVRAELDAVHRQFAEWQQGLELLQDRISEREKRRDESLEKMNQSIQTLVRGYQKELPEPSPSDGS